MTPAILLLLVLQPAGDTEAQVGGQAVRMADYVPCAVTSLYVVTRLRGLNVRFAEVANLVGPADADETHSFAQIVEAARRLGIEAIPLKVGPRELANLPTPAIVQVNKPKDDQAIPHLQVFLGSDARGVRLLDPPYPAHVIPLARFRQTWTGHILVFPHDNDEAFAIRTMVWDRLAARVAWYSWCGLGVALVVSVTGAWKVLGRRGACAIWSTGRHWLYGAISLGAASGLVWAGVVWITDRARHQPARCDVTPDIRELGNLSPGRHDVQVPISNPGRNALHVTRVLSSCTCAAVKAPSVVRPGQTEDIVVTLDVDPGPKTAQLRIESDDPVGAKSVTLNWHGNGQPRLLPPWVAATGAPVDRVFVQSVKLIFPGGRTAELPRFLRVESESPLIEVSVSQPNPTAYRLTYGSRLVMEQGEQTIEVKARPITAGGRLTASPTLHYLYGGKELKITLPVDLTFYGGDLTPDVSSVAFSAATDDQLIGQNRTIRVRRRHPDGKIDVRNVPEWLSVQLQSDNPNNVALRLMVTGRPASGTHVHNLVLTAVETRDDVSLDVRVFTPERKAHEN